MSKKVFVGMSGGVDSSVTAALMVEQGYDVTGVYMKNWSQDLPGHYCPWKEDYQDAKRVAAQLGIKFKMYDFETEYTDKVVKYMIDEYKLGLTPNPDIMCNQEVKFKLFLETALADGADLIATGHYSRIVGDQLWMAVDKNKDQSYFLCRVPKSALSRVLFPIGEFDKPMIRKMAKDRGLVTAAKKDSQGICFIGKVSIKEFLSQYVETNSGPIIDQHGKQIGTHEGALFYTIGQRQGLKVGGGLPYYVVDKDMDNNIIYVTTDLADSRLWTDEIKLTKLHWLDKLDLKQKDYKVRTRYRAPLIKINQVKTEGKLLILKLDNEVRAVTPGQSAVIYLTDQLVGSGIVI
ncbi:MAG TPA: tRNA 2-thiouridine(34) synthase MnmA [Candidatus Saccharimonadales bacterium]|jgi:tRNA-specific 2-thiouridylase|nr:tRNA 2-thiouridine(34) synthase MnmA [Candidatus Saccharimonadales bacterium]